MRKADNLPPSCAVVTKSGSLYFLEPSGPVQACNRAALSLYPTPCSLGINDSGNMTRVLPTSSTMNAELSVCLIKHHVMKTNQAATIRIQAFLTSTSDESGQFHTPFVVLRRKSSSVTTRYGAGLFLEPV